MIAAARQIPKTGRSGAALLLALLLSACADLPSQDGPPQATVQPPPDPAPSQAEIRQARAERARATNQAAAQAAARASDFSRTQREFYAAMERRLITAGKLRRDRVPLDAPIDAEMLARNFLTIALRDEYGADGRHAGADGVPAPLRRWQQPVRLQLEFGASASQPLRNSVTGEVAAYADRLSRVSGHRIGMAANGGNFTILVLTEDERLQVTPRLREMMPDIPAGDAEMIRDLDPENTCIVLAYSQQGSASYARAVALIRAELPSLLRTSCLHEEIAQGLGLANDNLHVRPSIFNDDEEFALLTRHDELLLQILYDPRLRPGMTEAEAGPIVRRIAAELLDESV